MKKIISLTLQILLSSPLLFLAAPNVAYAEGGTCQSYDAVFTNRYGINNCSTGYQPSVTPKGSGDNQTFECQCVPCSGTCDIPNSNGSKLSNPNPCANGTGVETALGCIPTSIEGFASTLFSIALGIAGALATLFIIIGGFKVATSQGDPDSLQDGKDMITQAIIGLVFILLATSILAIIGIDILGLKAFSRSGTGININP